MTPTRRTLLGTALAAPFVRSARAAPVGITFAAYSGIFQENYQAAVIAPFEAAHPDIKVTYYATPNSAQTLGLLRAQKAAPQIDLALLDITVAKTGTDENLFVPLDRGRLPVLAELSPRAFAPGVHGAALTFDNLVLLYAPDRVKPAPTSWRVLWDPAYAGQIAFAGAPDIVGLGFTLIANAVFGGKPDDPALEAGLAAVAQMAPGVLSWDPRPDAYSFIINGTSSLGVGWNARGQLYAARSDGHLAVALPDEGSVFQINMIELVRGAPQTEAAERFLAYALGAEAQKAFTERMFYAPVNMTAAIGPDAMARTAATSERQAKMLDVDWLRIARSREAIAEQWRRRILTRR